MRRSDEEPDFGSEEHLEVVFDHESGCEFCGHADHRMIECPARWEAYSDPYGSVRRRSRR